MFRMTVLLFLGRFLLNNAQHLVFAHDQVVLTFELDFLPGVLAEEDQVIRTSRPAGGPSRHP